MRKRGSLITPSITRSFFFFFFEDKRNYRVIHVLVLLVIEPAKQDKYTSCSSSTNKIRKPFLHSERQNMLHKARLVSGLALTMQAGDSFSSTVFFFFLTLLLSNTCRRCPRGAGVTHSQSEAGVSIIPVAMADLQSTGYIFSSHNTDRSKSCLLQTGVDDPSRM